MIGSLILPVLVLLVPVVLVFAFAGCGEYINTNVPPQEKPPEKPPDPPVVVVVPPPPPMPGDPYRAEILKEPGLVGYWRLAETTGNIANDSGPNARGGVYKELPTLGAPGALAAKQPGDTAVRFDGTGQLAEVAVGPAAGIPAGAPDPLLPPMGFSLEAWVSLTPNAPSAGAGEFDVVFDSIEISDGQVRGFHLYMARGATPPSIHGAVGTGVAGTPAELIDDVNIALPADVLAGTWAHAVLTHEVAGGAGKLTLYLSYLDSASGTPQRLSAPPATVNYARDQAQVQPLRIAAGQDAVGDPGSFFPGSIDEVALYNTVLPPARVNAHFDMSLA